MAKTNTTIVTGVDAAIVVTTGGAQRTVRRGQKLPTGLRKGETERLAALGVFGDPEASKAPAAAATTTQSDAERDALAAQLETANAELEQANEKLEAAARLAPVVAQSVEKIAAYVADNPEDLDAIKWLESKGPSPRDGVINLTTS